MDQNDNKKVIIAIVIVIIVILAGVAIAVAVNNNNGGGEKETYAKVDGLHLLGDDTDIPAYIVDKNDKKINLVSASGAELPKSSTTISCDTTGWTWNATTKCYTNSTHTLKVEVANATIENTGTGGKLEYKVSYEKDAKVDLTVTYNTIQSMTLHIKANTFTCSDVPNFYITNNEGTKVNIKNALTEGKGEEAQYKVANIKLPASGSTQIYTEDGGWTKSPDSLTWTKGTCTFSVEDSEDITVTADPVTGNISFTLTYDATGQLGTLELFISDGQ